MSDRIEAEILDVLGEEVAAAVDTPLVVIEGPKGDPGKDGITPTIGPNGNWYLGAEDTGKPSRGAIGAPGKDGNPGVPGKDGAPGVYYGTTPPTGDTHPVWIDPDGGPDDGGLLPAVTAADNGKVLRVVSSAWAAADMPSGGSPDAVLYTAQDLTDTQKKQARDNVDAASNDFVINATVASDNTCTTDKTYAQIQEAIQDGKRAVMKARLSGTDFILPQVGKFLGYYAFAAVLNLASNVALQYTIMVGAQDNNVINCRVVTYDTDGNLQQVTMDSDPTEAMEIATKQYVDASGVPSVTAADNGKVLRVVNGAWEPVDMPSGGTVGSGGETWELVAEATTTDVVNSMRVTFDACSAVYVEFCWGGVENDLGDIAIYPNTGDTPYAGEKRVAAAYVTSSASRKRGMLCVRMDCRVGTHWTAVSNQKYRGHGGFGSINADDLMNMDVGVDPDVQYSVISSYYMTTKNDTPASGVKSITAYGAGMAIGTRIKVWGIKK